MANRFLHLHKMEQREKEVPLDISNTSHEEDSNGPSSSEKDDATLMANSLCPHESGNALEICQWYFLHRLPDKDVDLFDVIQTYWVKGLWDQGLTSPSVFAAVGALVLQKKSIIIGRHANCQYYEQKLFAIRSVATELRQNSVKTNSIVVLAIALLAVLEMHEAESEAGEKHLNAVSKLFDLSSMPLQNWLYCAWIDLRYALANAQEPTLRFCVPESLRGVHPVIAPRQAEFIRMGTVNASKCPHTSLAAMEATSDLFCKLHALCWCSEMLSSTEMPPFGQIYVLEYSLRLAYAQAVRRASTRNLSLEALVVSAMQEHIWLATRFWIPQSDEMHHHLVTEACAMIEGFDDMVAQWSVCADLQSLLWVLYTLVHSSWVQIIHGSRHFWTSSM